MSELIILTLAFFTSVLSLVILLRKHLNKYLNKKITQIDLEFEKAEQKKLNIIDTFEQLNEEKFQLLRSRDVELRNKIDIFLEEKKKKIEEINQDIEKRLNNFELEIKNSTESKLAEIKKNTIDSLFSELSNVKVKEDDDLMDSYIDKIDKKFNKKI